MKQVVKFVRTYIKEIAAIAVACVAPYAVLQIATMIGGKISAALVAAGSLTSKGMLVAGAIGGATAGLITTGSIKGTLTGAISGAAFAGVGNLFAETGSLHKIGTIIVGSGEKVATAAKVITHSFKTLSHGFVGGIRSVMSGGSFNTGFLSAGFAEGVASATDFARVIKGRTGLVSEAVVGGIAGGAGATIGGGNFLDGFRSGVFSRVFNQLTHMYYLMHLSPTLNSEVRAFEKTASNAIITATYGVVDYGVPTVVTGSMLILGIEAGPVVVPLVRTAFYNYGPQIATAGNLVTKLAQDKYGTGQPGYFELMGRIGDWINGDNEKD